MINMITVIKKDKISAIKAKTRVVPSNSGQVPRLGSGQVTMETAAAVIAVFVFFLGVLQIFSWFSSVLVKRQQYYQESRTNAASIDEGVVGDFTYAPPELNIFDREE